jgi:AraC-like DNA-binding protein
VRPHERPWWWDSRRTGTHSLRRTRLPPSTQPDSERRIEPVYREAPPPSHLADAVRCVWRSARAGAQRIVPDGCLDLVVGEGRVFVAGPDTRAWHTEQAPDSPLYGIRFKPGHAPRVLGAAADELLDQRVELAELWGRRGRAATERLLGQPETLVDVVTENLRAEADHELDKLLAALTAGVPRVSAALAGLATGERQLRRRFTRAVGYGPATYLRVARLSRAIDRAGRAPDLATLAAVAGYADQAHLSRDWRELTGTTPREFFRDRMRSK